MNAEGAKGAKVRKGRTGKCKCEYRGLSTAHDMKPSCFGRDDKGWGDVSEERENTEILREAQNDGVG